MRKKHIALYGTVPLHRAYCESCEGYAFVIDGRLKCCDALAEETEARGFKMMSEIPNEKKGPSKSTKTRLLREQDHRCFYCNRRFNTFVYRKARRISLAVNWDHKVPFVYGRNNGPDNFVAACHVCNSLKSSHVFTTLEELQVFLTTRWEEKGFTDQQPLTMVERYMGCSRP